MTPAAFWTEADAAELELLTHELVDVAFRHRGSCATCSSRGPWCPAMAEALEAVLEWREGRILRSRAALLRAGQELVEFRADLERVV